MAVGLAHWFHGATAACHRGGRGCFYCTRHVVAKTVDAIRNRQPRQITARLARWLPPRKAGAK